MIFLAHEGDGARQVLLEVNCGDIRELLRVNQTVGEDGDAIGFLQYLEQNLVACSEAVGLDVHAFFFQRLNYDGVKPGAGAQEGHGILRCLGKGNLGAFTEGVIFITGKHEGVV